MSRIYLGIDTALVNNGVSAIVSPEDCLADDGFNIKVKTTVDNQNPKDGYWDTSDIMKAKYQKESVLKNIANLKPEAVALESPAYSYTGSMQISIGIIHGVLTEVIDSIGTPWLWISPTQWKFALMGKGKHTKAEHIKFVCSHFDIPAEFKNIRGRIDDNQADSICMAYMAYVFHMKALHKSFYYWNDSELLKRLAHIFDRKKEGIMLHKNSRIFNIDIICKSQKTI